MEKRKKKCFTTLHHKFQLSSVPVLLVNFPLWVSVTEMINFMFVVVFKNNSPLRSLFDILSFIGPPIIKTGWRWTRPKNYWWPFLTGLTKQKEEMLWKVFLLSWSPRGVFNLSYFIWLFFLNLTLEWKIININWMIDRV